MQTYLVVPQVDVTLQEEQIGEGAGGRCEAGFLAAHPVEEVYIFPLFTKRINIQTPYYEGIHIIKAF